MAEDTNSSSGYEQNSANLNGRAINFTNTTSSEMIPMGLGVSSGNSAGYFSGRLNANMILNSGVIGGGSGIIGSGSGGSLLVDSVPGLKHDAGVAAEWTAEEQYILEEGLHKFRDEPTIMKYVKIAATLRDKTVRDVALRCRWWMTRKRRKPEEQNGGRKVNNRRDKLLEASLKTNVSVAPPTSIAAYKYMMGQIGQNEHKPFEGISGTAKHLLEQNAHDFSQITNNLSELKLQENIDLFCRTRNNITALLNEMKEMPGIMSQMPPLRVSVDEDLVNSILPNSMQGLFDRYS